MNSMRELKLEKVVLNIGIGEGGDRLAKAEKVMERLTGMTPARTFARKTIREWGIKEGSPIGCMVTLRGEKAWEMLGRLLEAVERKVRRESFDNEGNFSFGIKEHIDIPGVSYDPDLGIFGMDVCVKIGRAGDRIKHRSRMSRKLPRKQRVAAEEAINFMTEKFGVQVV
ncbi:MAG: 50S ribosomal protein L5 [Candidatus Hadarchaeales archaeon]